MGSTGFPLVLIICQRHLFVWKGTYAHLGDPIMQAHASGVGSLVMPMQFEDATTVFFFFLMAA